MPPTYPQTPHTHPQAQDSRNEKGLIPKLCRYNEGPRVEKCRPEREILLITLQCWVPKAMERPAGLLQSPSSRTVIVCKIGHHLRLPFYPIDSSSAILVHLIESYLPTRNSNENKEEEEEGGRQHFEGKKRTCEK